jgi:hypothetical protein
VRGQFYGDVPWQQLLNVIDRMLADAGEHVAEVGFQSSRSSALFLSDHRGWRRARRLSPSR